MLTITSPTKEQKKERKLKNVVLEYFFNKYMIQEKGVTIEQSEVIEAILKLCETSLPIIKLSIEKAQITNFLKHKGFYFFRSVSWVKYMDLALNAKAIKRFFPEKLFRSNLLQIKKNLSNLEMNSVKAWELLSCDLSEKLLTNIVKSNNNLLNKINLNHTIYNLRLIEKLLFRKNIYRVASAKVGCALYITKANHLTQRYIAEIMGINILTLRNLLIIISTPNDQKKRERIWRKTLGMPQLL